MDTIFECAKIPTDIHDKPRIPVTIFDSGELKMNKVQDGETQNDDQSSSMPLKKRERVERLKALEDKSLEEAGEEDPELIKGVVEVDEGVDDAESMKDDRLRELKLRINQAKKAEQ